MANYRHSKKTLLAFLTALSISLGASGCTNTDKKQLRKEIETEIDTQVTSTPSPTLTPEELEKIEMEKLVTEYLDYFSTIDVKYPNEKYYPSKKEIDKIIALDDTYQEYHHQDSITIDELYKIIKKNSILDAKRNSKFQSPFVNKQDKSYFNLSWERREFEYALHDILKYLKTNATNDFSEDICKMKDLKIIFSDERTIYKKLIELNTTYDEFLIGGIYDEKENRIMLNPHQLPGKVGDLGRSASYKNILEHLLSHLSSTACKHKRKKGQKFNRILGNHISLMEASAESSRYALSTFSNQYYCLENFFEHESDRENESLILLLGLFHNNQDYDNYYNAISDSNPEAFYHFCGMNSKEEKYTLYKILAAMDFSLYGYGLNDIDRLESCINYKLDIFHKVLSNMVDYTSTHPDFTIEENLQMLNIIECCILNGSMNLTTKNKFDCKFIIDFYQSETKYLDFLSSYYFKGEKDSDEIKEDYQENFIEPTAFLDCYEHLDYDDNELLQKFPLLRPIIFANPYAEHQHEYFVEENKKFIKEKCKTK